MTIRVDVEDRVTSPRCVGHGIGSALATVATAVDGGDAQPALSVPELGIMVLKSRGTPWYVYLGFTILVPSAVVFALSDRLIQNSWWWAMLIIAAVIPVLLMLRRIGHNENSDTDAHSGDDS
ncbi:hypothetical protein GCM10009872_54300 [Actinopolymorpha rutila]